FEIDPTTNRVLSMSHHKYEGLWEPTYRADYEWDVEIPDSIREFRPPEGTILQRLTWWESRADELLDRSTTEDWDVTLHAVDVNPQRDVTLSLSRINTPDSAVQAVYNTAEPIRVDAVGSSGERYEQLSRYGCYNAYDVGYWTTTLERQEPGDDPRAVTLTIEPFPKGVSEGQSVIFRYVPLPPRQDVEDVYLTAIEVTEY
ncbi:MAG: hypothetical protein IMF16_02110, partial [Proteobacteria bacterium]|nr:hypothetical protein [Pseudomonadota bacterium]